MMTFRSKMTMRDFFRWNALLLAATLLSLHAAHNWVKHTTQNQVYTTIDKIPANEVGIVLGTSKEASYGTNLYFKYRMEAAAELYHAGKIKHILVSGDNGTKAYDEPTDMLNYLMALGVPEKDITRDYAGFRTYDSIVRCSKIFGQSKVTIISQGFHNQRALFIANNRGMDAVAFNARDVHANTPAREYLARIVACIDVYIWNRQPRFLGQFEPIEV
jgi:SanA protein